MKKKPRGRVPSLIGGSNGKPKRGVAKRSCKCARCGETIASGQRYVAIPKLGGGFAYSKRYCDECFQEILAKTTVDLEELRGI